jgi:hypothetical protein
LKADRVPELSNTILPEQTITPSGYIFFLQYESFGRDGG